MCLIVDNSVAQRVFLQKDDPDYSDLLKALHNPKRRVVLIHGGFLTTELYGNHDVGNVITTLEAAGKARKIDDIKVNQEAVSVATMSIKSDDPHVLALARYSGTRVLCTDDGDLIVDFKNLAIVKPKGYIYSRKSHINLLRKHCS